MSLIVRDMQTDQIQIMCKGADNIMFPLIKGKDEILKVTTDQLYDFACMGLRTLVMGAKDLEEKFFDDWILRLKKAK